MGKRRFKASENDYSGHYLQSPLLTHKQHSLCFYLNLPNGLRSSPPYIYFMSFMGSEKKLLIVGYLQKEKTYVRIYSAALQSWRELLLKQSHTALFEKD